MSEERWCVVTGGRGFAARHLVEMLIQYNMFSVRIADLSPTIQLSPNEEGGILDEALKSGRAQYTCTDLRNKAQVLKGQILRQSLFMLKMQCLCLCTCVVFFDASVAFVHFMLVLVLQHVRELRLCSTWPLQIRPSTITNSITLLMCKVDDLELWLLPLGNDFGV